MARMAMFNRVAQNKKKVKQTDMFDAEAARKRILAGDDEWKESKQYDLTRYHKAKEAMKNWAKSTGKGEEE